MQRLEVRGAVRPVYWSLGVKRLRINSLNTSLFADIQKFPLARDPYKKSFAISNFLKYFIQGLSKIFEHLLLWPPRSPDLTPCDFFLWGYVKDNAYKPQTAGSHSSCGANH